MSNRADSATTDHLPTGASDPTVVVLGGEDAKGLASHLQEEYDVTLLTDDEQIVRTAKRGGLDARPVDLTSGRDLEIHAEGMDAAVVAADRDRESLLATQLLGTVCGVESIAVRVNDPDNRELFRDVDAELLADRRELGTEVERTLFGTST